MVAILLAELTTEYAIIAQVDHLLPEFLKSMEKLGFIINNQNDLFSRYINPRVCCIQIITTFHILYYLWRSTLSFMKLPNVFYIFKNRPMAHRSSIHNGL
jgi:hypothetical protein